MKAKAKRASAKEWGDRVNKMLNDDCPHGLTEENSMGAIVPVSGWNCWGCTRDAVAKVVRSVRRGL